ADDRSRQPGRPTAESLITNAGCRMAVVERRARGASLCSFLMLKRIAVAAASIAAASALLSASAATFWTVGTQTDFLKGDVENLSIDSDGRVFLGPAAAQVAETGAPFIWTVLPAAAGSMWAGTGNEGQVLKIARDGKTSTFFDAAEKEVHAIAAAPGGRLFVGPAPA